MDTAKKQALLQKKGEQYKRRDTPKKRDLLNEKAEQYKVMDSAKKQDHRTIQNNGCKHFLRNPKKNTLPALLRRQ